MRRRITAFVLAAIAAVAFTAIAVTPASAHGKCEKDESGEVVCW
ncbi:hypothetical protein [Tenggerimyces flavus]|uniref:Uncharacterized protein n=1 Tax=Tenggerimyces flavus TaxID=1708749 RepID=A0ABV7YAU4_9ACTN|nr:hypothetical protein [Tenggerimyces flavus]MBM7783782.1 hypothetical protein [Tenggerimyces flavus]